MPIEKKNDKAKDSKAKTNEKVATNAAEKITEKSAEKITKKTVKKSKVTSIAESKPDTKEEESLIPKLSVIDFDDLDDFEVTPEDEYDYLDNSKIKTNLTPDALDSSMQTRLSENATENNFIQMAKFKILSKEEEFDMAKRIEIGLFAAHQLEEGLVAKKDIKDYEWLVEDGKRAKTIFANANRKLISATIKKMANTTSVRHADYSTMTIYGQMGLDIAINKYDYKMGYRFSTIAMMRIWATINSEVTKNMRLVKTPQHILERIRRMRKHSMEFESEHGRTPNIKELTVLLELDEKEIKLLLDAEATEKSIHETLGDIDGSLYIDTVEDESLENIFESDAKKNENIKLMEVLEKIANKDEKAKNAFSLFYGFDPECGKIVDKTELGKLLNVGEQQVDNLIHRAEAKICHPAFGLLADISGVSRAEKR